MARVLRVQHPGAIYHGMNRGDRSESVFAAKEHGSRRRKGDLGKVRLTSELRAWRAITSQHVYRLATLFLCGSLLGSLASEASNTPPWDSTSKRLVATAHSSFMLEKFLKVSPNARRVALAVRKDDKTAVALNGRVGKFYKYMNGSPPIQHEFQSAGIRGWD